MQAKRLAAEEQDKPQGSSNNTPFSLADSAGGGLTYLDLYLEVCPEGYTPWIAPMGDVCR